jgi:hypothetical protein
MTTEIILITPEDLDPTTLEIHEGKVRVKTATDTTAGVVALAVDANFPSTSDEEATTPAYVDTAIQTAIDAIPDAEDEVKGVVALNLGNTEGDDDNDVDALTSSGINELFNAEGVAPNAVQQAVVNAVAQALIEDEDAQLAIAEAIKEETHTLFPEATDEVQGKVALNLGNAEGDDDNEVDALTSSGINSLLADSTPGGNAVQQAVLDSVVHVLNTDSGAQDVLAEALVDDIHSKFPAATDTVQGKVSLAVAANFPSTSDEEAVTPAYVTAAVDTGIAAIPPLPSATDTVQGKVALNLGAATGDAENEVDALTASGINALMNSANPILNAVQQAVVNAVERGIANDFDAQLAIADAIKEETYELFPIASDAEQGKVALNTGSSLPGDAVNATDALTASGIANILNDTAVGGNAAQKSVVNAVEQALVSDAGAQAVIADLLKEESSAAIAGHAPSMANLVNAFPAATDTVQGKVALATSADFPNPTNNVDAATPAYVQAVVNSAVSAIPIIEDAADTVKGKVALNLGNAVGDDNNSVDALTSSGLVALANSTVPAEGNAVQKAIANAVERSIGDDPGLQTSIANAIIDDLNALFNTSTVFQDLIRAKETTTTLTLVGGQYVYTNEDNTTSAISPTEFRSLDAGNAIGLGLDGKLKVVIPAQLPDDQVLSGDNSGTVDLVLTPVVVGDQTNYTILANLKVALTTPSAAPNALKLSGAGFYVDVASDTVAGVSALNLGTALPSDANNSTDALTSFGFNAIANDTTVTGGNPLQKAVVNAVEQAFSGDIGAQAAVAAALAGNSTAMSSLVAAVPAATDTVQGKVSLAVAANFPSTSDEEAATPAYIQAAVSAALAAQPDVFGN